ncbi:DUF7857 domain-containing protein [Halosimplex halophilum]|uniref:DUF7857 domain-containing protein n=1 Tax=Halosimplex halophilum TaxID=2559572 RepID=UPI00107F3041|nr:hypothetical protein [Halosimplex halophilum]
MVTLEWSCERSDGVTLVSLVVAADRPCRVRVENRLDGPVWPPRRRGQPATGWDGDAFTGTVPETGRLTAGYATPARPADPPAEVVSTEPAEPDEGDGDGEPAGPAPAVESTPAGVVRDLGDPVVPRDSVPLPGRDAEPSPEADDDTGTDRERRADTGEGRAVNEGADAERLVVPGAVRAWLRDVDERLDAEPGESRSRPGEAGRRRDGPGSRVEGRGSDAALGAAVAADRRALRRVRGRIDELLARTGGADRTPEHRRAGESVGGREPADREVRPGGTGGGGR